MEDKEKDIYINSRRESLLKLRSLFIARESINVEIKKLRKKLDSLDNMIL
jgi:hypothetical protein